MNQETVKRLLDLNRQFYQTFALQFSADRMRLQPGVRRILEWLPKEARLLDLGCGNGELARNLVRRGQQGYYVGLDSSAELLEIARASLVGQAAAPQAVTFPCYFIQADLANPGWEASIVSTLSVTDGDPPFSPFDHVLAFAVLHHLPGGELRRRVLSQARGLLADGGRFIHSEWQFLHSPRLRERIQPWEAIGLSPGVVDPGDFLLDWRHGGYGLRYVHHFSEAELEGLAAETGFTIQETSLSDGEGGKLGLYQVWEKSKT